MSPNTRQSDARQRPLPLARPRRTLIVHLDVDAFFASVEQRLIPSLRRRPVIVGSGVIASCSYEARRAGCYAGQPLHEARRVCPDAVILPGQYPIYHCFAEHVWQVARRFTCGLETFLDEAYGDVTGMDALHGHPQTLGEHLQRAVADEVGLPISVGLARNRMLAKMASSSAKPGGVRHLADTDVEAFLAPLPIRKLPGVGGKTESLLTDMNVTTIGDFHALSRNYLRQTLGQRGERLYDRARGDDAQPLRPEARPGSISRETTLHKPTCDLGEINAMLQYLLERAMRAARAAALLAGGVEVSIRYDDWRHNRATRTLPIPTQDDAEVLRVVWALRKQLHTRRVAVRHLGVVLRHFRNAAEGVTLFEADLQRHHRRLHAALDDIRDRFGHASVVSGQSISLLNTLEQNEHGFVLRTPSLTK